MTGPQAPLSAAPPVTWSRIELEPGLEVHVSDGYRPPQGEGALRRLSQSFLNILKALGAQTPGRGGR
jgi:hypothetical protein